MSHHETDFEALIEFLVKVSEDHIKQDVYLKQAIGNFLNTEDNRILVECVEILIESGELARVNNGFIYHLKRANHKCNFLYFRGGTFI